jgi:hypothetical protein
VSARVVSRPYPNRRTRVGRDGTYPWAVTLKQGCAVETRRFHDRAEADALYERAVAAGFEERGK